MIFRKDKIRIYLEQSESDAIKYATEDLRNDLVSVVCETTEYNKSFEIFVGNIQNESTIEFLDNAGVYYRDITNKKDAYKVFIAFDKVFILGNGVLATIYAVYEFSSSTLMVSPFAFWTDEKPEKREVIKVKEVFVNSYSYAYRCFSIGDEDCLSVLSTSNKQRYCWKDKFSHVTDAEYIIQACKTALRLKYNVIIPATMLNIMNPHEEAIVKCITSLGLYITQNFYEPLGVSFNTWNYYWSSKDKEGLKPSYEDNKEFFIKIWEDYVDKWSNYPNVLWQIGLACQQNSALPFYDHRKIKTEQDKFEIICDVLDTQCSMVYDFVDDEDVKFILLEDENNASVLADKRFSLSNNVIVVRRSDAPKKKKREFYGAGIWQFTANVVNGAHNVQYPDVGMIHSVTQPHKRNESSLAGISVGNIRERFFNIYLFGELAFSEGRQNTATSDFCSLLFGESKTEQAYYEFNRAYFNEGFLLTDVGAYNFAIHLIHKIKKGESVEKLHYTDLQGKKRNVSRKRLIVDLEKSMVRLVQFIINTTHNYERSINEEYYTYSLINQPKVLLNAYSIVANLFRYATSKEEKYKQLVIDHAVKITNLYEDMAYGRWQGAYKKNYLDYQLIINQTKEI